MHHNTIMRTSLYTLVTVIDPIVHTFNSFYIETNPIQTIELPPMQVNTTEPSSLPILGPRPQKQQKKPASQLRFIRPAQMSLFARVSCYPPLGQVTCAQRIQKALELEKDDTVSCPIVHYLLKDSSNTNSSDLPSSLNQASHSRNNHGRLRFGITSPQLLLPALPQPTVAAPPAAPQNGNPSLSTKPPQPALQC